jgi:uncharacterized membrane protein (UPF0127 family)
VARWVLARNASRGDVVLVRARWCSGFGAKLRGLTFRRRLEPGTGVVLVEGRPARLSTAIHMAFVFFPLGVAWLDADGRVVDCRLARPWRIYVPHSSAKFVLEGPPEMLECLGLGECIAFDESSMDT